MLFLSPAGIYGLPKNYDVWQWIEERPSLDKKITYKLGYLFWQTYTSPFYIVKPFGGVFSRIVVHLWSKKKLLNNDTVGKRLWTRCILQMLMSPASSDRLATVIMKFEYAELPLETLFRKNKHIDW